MDIDIWGSRKVAEIKQQEFSCEGKVDYCCFVIVLIYTCFLCARKKLRRYKRAQIRLVVMTVTSYHLFCKTKRHWGWTERCQRDIEL